MLLISDLHLREETEEIVLGNVLPGMRQACAQLQDKQVVCLGDVFHMRYRVSARLLNGLRDELRQWVAQGIKLDILPGNHDQYQVDGRHVLEYLGDVSPTIKIHSVPEVDGLGFWMPYRSAGAREQLQLLAKANRGARAAELPLFVHLPLRGAVLTTTQVDTDGVEPDFLTSWPVVFAGHYHMHQRLPGLNAWYIGSPYQVSAAEAGQPKGFAQWVQSGATPPQLFFHERRWAPRYHVMHVGKGESMDFSQVSPGDDVRVQVAPGVNIDSVSQALRTVGVRHTVTPDVEPTEARLAVGPVATIAEYAEAYANLKAAEDELDPKYLMQVFAELTR
jgi:DNA repair exonuclease SbcCD nuclease subunit